MAKKTMVLGLLVVFFILVAGAVAASQVQHWRGADVAVSATVMVAAETPAGATFTPFPTSTRKPIPATYTAIAQANQPTNQPSIQPTNQPTIQPTNQPTIQPTNQPTIQPTNQPSNTPTATATPLPLPSPTPHGFASPDPDLPTPSTPIPTPVPAFAKPANVTNVLLLGNDVGERQGGRTDSIVIVSINEETKTATLLSLPRDLYVYIPGWTMNRINTALPHGHGVGYPGGGGGLVKDTIRYNFGIPIDYYVRIGFDGFQQAVDALGGVDVAVSCPLTDWRLKEPDLDPQVEENWEMFELDPGVWQMDGDMALWYVRSRRTTNDFERGRRQQQVLQAMLTQGVSVDVLAELPALWEAYRESVETDMTLPVMVRLAALAPAVRANGIQHLYMTEDARRAWRTPAGAAVQLPRWDGLAPILAQLMQPPALNRASRAPVTVEVVNGLDPFMFDLAADNLEWHGFVPVPGRGEGTVPDHTQITYYGTTFKGSFHRLLAWIFNISSDEIQLAEDPGAGQTDYRVILGYDYNPCRPQLEAPRALTD